MKKVTYFCDVCKAEILAIGNATCFTVIAKSNSTALIDADRADVHIDQSCWGQIRSLIKEQDHKAQVAAAGPRELKVP